MRGNTTDGASSTPSHLFRRRLMWPGIYKLMSSSRPDKGPAAFRCIAGVTVLGSAVFIHLFNHFKCAYHVYQVTHDYLHSTLNNSFIQGNFIILKFQGNWSSNTSMVLLSTWRIICSFFLNSYPPRIKNPSLSPSTEVFFRTDQ